MLKKCTVFCICLEVELNKKFQKVWNLTHILINKYQGVSEYILWISCTESTDQNFLLFIIYPVGDITKSASKSFGFVS